MAPRETGAQRAQRRAAAHGLTVGAPVRAVLGKPTALNWPEAVPGRRYGQDHYAGPGGAAPLDFGQRLSNYQIQASVRDHALVGTRWRPTPRQRRRLDKKARQSSYRKLLESQRLDAATAPWNEPALVERVTNLATGEQRTEPLTAPVTPQQFAGFRVVDRRGEHRS